MLPKEEADFYNLPQGVYVSENGADLQKHDVITAIDGVEIRTMDELTEQKNKHNAGETVTLRNSRNSQSMEVQVTFAREQAGKLMKSVNKHSKGQRKSCPCESIPNLV